MPSIDELQAYIEISQVKARYCRTLDTKDWAGFGDVFTSDIELDTRPAGGTLTHGREETVKMVRSAIETAITAHQVHSPEITLDGDTAHVIWAMQDRIVWGADQKGKMGGIRGFTGYGHYRERYVRQDGRWRIAAQVLTRLHMDIDHGKAP